MNTRKTLPQLVPHHSGALDADSSPTHIDLPTLSAPTDHAVLGNFQIMGRLGEGTYATAYHAKQLGTDREAVVKIAHAHLIQGQMSSVIRQRFEVELRASTRVKHPNIVTIYTAGEVNGLPAIAMEYVPGAMLEDFLTAHAPLDQSTIISMFAQLAGAMMAMHRMRIVHRDISPRNIIVNEPTQGQVHVKLLDFGISQLDGGTKHTAGPIGTPQFMAPEMLRGETSLAVDVFSLGQLMWWAATGETLFPDSANQFQLFKLLSEMRRPKLGYKGTQLDPELSELIERMLDPDPGQRPTAVECFAVLGAMSSPSPSDSAEFFQLRHTAPVRLDVKPNVLLLTHPTVPNSVVLDALPLEQLDLCQVELLDWSRGTTHELSSFDLVLVPMGNNALDALRPTILDLIESRRRSRSTTKLHAYSQTMLPRELLKDVGLDEVWVLPRESAAMQITIKRLRPSTGTHKTLDTDKLNRSMESDAESTQHIIDEFIGIMPELLLEIEDCLEDHDRTALFSICGELSSRAMSVSAENILKHTRALCELPVSMYALRGAQLVEQLEEEYKQLFTELMSVRQRD